MRLIYDMSLFFSVLANRSGPDAADSSSSEVIPAESYKDDLVATGPLLSELIPFAGRTIPDERTDKRSSGVNQIVAACKDLTHAVESKLSDLSPRHKADIQVVAAVAHRCFQLTTAEGRCDLIVEMGTALVNMCTVGVDAATDSLSLQIRGLCGWVHERMASHDECT